MNYKDPNVNAGYLPLAELVAPSQKNTRRPSEKLLNWETNFIDKCCEGTKYPSRALKSQWALILAEKRVRNMKPNAESKENLQLQQKWLTHYEEQIDGWIKNRISSSRQEGETPRKHLGSEKNPFLPTAANKSTSHSTPVQPFALRKNHSGFLDIHEEGFRGDLPRIEGVAVDVKHNTGIVSAAISLDDDEVFRTGSRLDILAHIASLQQPLPVPNKRQLHPTSINPGRQME